MRDKPDKDRERPDFVRNYHPVAIRSVVTAHAMIPKTWLELAIELPADERRFALMPGFHSLRRIEF